MPVSPFLSVIMRTPSAPHQPRRPNRRQHQRRTGLCTATGPARSTQRHPTAAGKNGRASVIARNSYGSGALVWPSSRRRSPIPRTIVPRDGIPHGLSVQRHRIVAPRSLLRAHRSMIRTSSHVEGLGGDAVVLVNSTTDETHVSTCSCCDLTEQSMFHKNRRSGIQSVVFSTYMRVVFE